MFQNLLKTPVLIAAVASVLAAGPMSAQAAEIRDDAKFFSREAREKANARISAWEKQTGKQLHIETFATPPSGNSQEVAKMAKGDREKFFEKWVRDQAGAEHAKGIFVLICREPGHVQVVADRQMHNQGFGPRQVSEVRDRILAGFKQKDYDKGLLDAVDYVSLNATSKSRSGAPGVTPLPRATEIRPHGTGHNQPVPEQRLPQQGGGGMGLWGWIILAVVVFLAFRVIGGIIRMFSGANRPGSGAGGQYGPGPGYGGGGMLGGLMTGLFGAFAGHMLYDSFFGNSAHAGHHDQFGGSGNANDGAGDFGGGDSGAGDFSNGDSAGGDFGGGDFGGGDFGGGGGDGGGDF